MAKRDPMIVTGSGRSGTNWLLNLIDLHPETHCRNEPEQIPNSPMGNLVYKHFGPLELERYWDEAVEWASTHVGERDRRPQSHKAHIHDWSARSGIAQLSYKRSGRKVLRFANPQLGRSDWELPWWVGSQRKLRDAIPVLKVPSCHRWFMWVLENRPDTKVVNIVRHPGGAISSWKARYLQQNDEKSVHEANRARLHEVVKESPEWAAIFGEIDAMQVVEAEVWYWAYATTSLHSFAKGRPNYHCLTYESLIEDQVEQLRGVYDAYGLEWSREVEDQLVRPAESKGKHWSDRIAASSARTDSWREKLSEEEKSFIERALATTVFADWWKR